MRADNDHVAFSSGNVFKDLDVVLTRDEWEALCLKSGSKLPYPFADVVQFKPRSDRPPER